MPKNRVCASQTIGARQGAAPCAMLGAAPNHNAIHCAPTSDDGILATRRFLNERRD